MVSVGVPPAGSGTGLTPNETAPWIRESEAGRQDIPGDADGRVPWSSASGDCGDG
jgi:hypothetical protein